MKKLLMAMAAMAAGIAVAAPGKPGAADPVAADYPAWTGVTMKNYIAGRPLVGPSDLRQRTTIVVEIDGEKAAEQFEATGIVATKNGIKALVGHGSASWETIEDLPRGVMVVYSVRNVKDREEVKKAVKPADEKKDTGRVELKASCAPIYEDVTFEGAPANGGKYPFFYVMGYEGKEVVASGQFDGKKSMTVIQKAINEQKVKLDEAQLVWHRFYGYVDEPKHFKDLAKALKKGGSLEQVEAKIKKGVTAKDPETAKEAQIMYDAIEQMKSDYMYRAMLEVTDAPHVAAHHAALVQKLWPKSKKQLADVAAKLKANGDAAPLIKAYSKMVTWSDPDFTCKNAGEVKKIIAELNKIKTSLNSLKESKNVKIQNGAMVLDSMIDELISIMPSKVPQK